MIQVDGLPTFTITPKSQYTEEINENVTIERDSRNRIIKMVGDQGNSNGNITTNEYDSKGGLIKSTFTNTPNTIVRD